MCIYVYSHTQTKCQRYWTVVTYICTYECMYAHLDIYIHVCIHVYMYIHTNQMSALLDCCHDSMRFGGSTICCPTWSADCQRRTWRRTSSAASSSTSSVSSTKPNRPVHTHTHKQTHCVCMYVCIHVNICVYIYNICLLDPCLRWCLLGIFEWGDHHCCACAPGTAL